MNLDSREVAVYIHWPFCKSKCPYCDFNSHVAKSIDYDAWLKKYLSEIEKYRSYLINLKIKSIFFGGGTPSLMPPYIIEGILNKINSISSISNAEITCEVNPTSFEAKKMLEFKSCGINRVSIGIQSFNDASLKFLGRNHSSSEALEALKQISNSFDNYSFDLIYALPNQTLDEWMHELEQAIKLNPKHISLYQLTIEPDTKFAAQYKAKRFSLPPHDLGYDLFKYTNECLSSNGYRHYEISNYSKPGFESIHNLNYWQYKSYIGIGPGAHGRIRCDCKPTFRSLLKILTEGNDSICNSVNNCNSTKNILATSSIRSPSQWLTTDQTIEFETLVGNEILQEICLMGLRLDTGINLLYFKKLTDLDLISILYLKTKNQLHQFYLDYFEFFDPKENIAYPINKIITNTIQDDLYIRIKRPNIYITDYLIAKLIEIITE